MNGKSICEPRKGHDPRLGLFSMGCNLRGHASGVDTIFSVYNRPRIPHKTAPWDNSMDTINLRELFQGEADGLRTDEHHQKQVLELGDLCHCDTFTT